MTIPGMSLAHTGIILMDCPSIAGLAAMDSHRRCLPASTGIIPECS